MSVRGHGLSGEGGVREETRRDETRRAWRCAAENVLGAGAAKGGKNGRSGERRRQQSKGKC